MEDVLTEAYSEAATEMPETGTEDSTNRESASDFQSQLAQRDATLVTERAERERIATELEGQKRRAEELEKSYRSYQQRTTQKLQRLGELERQGQSGDTTRAELMRMQAIVQRLANAVLDDSEKEQLALELEKANLRFKEEQITAQQQAQNNNQQQSFADVDPEAQKTQLFYYYAPNSSIDPKDSRIDWAGDAPNLQEWVRRFTSSVRSLETNDLTAVMAKQTEEAIKQAHAAATKTAEEARADVEKVKSTAAENARREEEERLRARGIDVADTAARPESDTRQVVQAMNQDLDEDLLRTVEGRRKWAELERQYRNKIFNR